MPGAVWMDGPGVSSTGSCRVWEQKNEWRVEIIFRKTQYDVCGLQCVGYVVFKACGVQFICSPCDVECTSMELPAPKKILL
jgi:hypothetical protein